MATIPNKIWAQATVYPPTAYDQLMKALMQYHDIIETDDQATLIWHQTSQAILLVYVYCSPVEKPAAFAPFYDIPSVMDIVPSALRTIYDLIQALADVNSPEPMLCVSASIPHQKPNAFIQQDRLTEPLLHPI